METHPGGRRQGRQPQPLYHFNPFHLEAREARLPDPSWQMKGTHLLIYGSAKGLLSSYFSQPCRTFQNQLSSHLYHYPSLEPLGISTHGHVDTRLVSFKANPVQGFLLKLSWKVCHRRLPIRVSGWQGICPDPHYCTTAPMQDRKPMQTIFHIRTNDLHSHVVHVTSLFECGEPYASGDSPHPALWLHLAASWPFSPSPISFICVDFPIS